MNKTDEHLDQLVDAMQALTDWLERMSRLVTRNVSGVDQMEAASIEQGLDNLRDRLIDLKMRLAKFLIKQVL